MKRDVSRLVSVTALAAVLATGLATPMSVHALEEGGYVGQEGEGHPDVVYNFLKHFSYDQYYWGVKSQITSNNDNRVDAMDIAIFAGHGNKWLFAMTDGSVNLGNAGGTSDGGWGDLDIEFAAFESCYVVPSPLEVSDWWSAWVGGSDDLFDGLHQLISFRTVSWQSTDQKVSDRFGDLVAGNYPVWQAWFRAINEKGKSDEKGAAVMHPDADGETYYNFGADPHPDHQSLRIWYQY